MQEETGGRHARVTQFIELLIEARQSAANEYKPGFLPPEGRLTFTQTLEKWDHLLGTEPSVYVDPRSGQLWFRITKSDVKKLKLGDEYGYVPRGSYGEFQGVLIADDAHLAALIVSGFFSDHRPVFVFAPKEKRE